VDQVDFALRADGGAPAQRERDPAEGRAISAVWMWFVRNQNKYDVPFATVVMKVRAQYPSANVGRIAAEFARRHRRALQLGRWG
jgi:hypothetical protein